MTRNIHWTIFAIFILLISCGKEAEPNIEADSDKKTTDFTPALEDYDFFIEGEIDGKLLRYEQVNDDWTNVSNTYFTEYEETWMQAYSDGETREGSWRIRIHDKDIENLELPYTLEVGEGSIRWFDERIDLIIANTDFCQGVDNGCTFSLSPANGEITVTKVEDQIIEGNFHGRAVIVRTGSSPGGDVTLYHDIENGKFRINYRVD